MPGKHTGHPTIAFRPSSDWQYRLIEERAMLSGMHKKDFIVRSCIYSNICFIGTKDNVNRIIDATEEFQNVICDIVSQLTAGDISVSDNTFKAFRGELLALCITVVDILNGAAYLYKKKPTENNMHWKMDLEIEQFNHILEVESQKQSE